MLVFVRLLLRPLGHTQGRARIGLLVWMVLVAVRAGSLPPPTPLPAPLVVDLRVAPHAVLARLPGIGVRRATAILRWREDVPTRDVHVRGLEAIPGIGPRTVNAIWNATDVRVIPRSPAGEGLR